MLPSLNDVEFYRKHGWWLTGRLFSEEEIDALVVATDRFYAGERDRQLPLRPPRTKNWSPQDGDVRREDDYVHYQSSAIADLILKPLIGAVAGRLMPAEEVRVMQVTLMHKPALADEPSNPVAMHNDRQYWATSTSDELLTVFIPLHDCDEEMGTIVMIDGSHRWPQSAAGSAVNSQFAKMSPAGREALVAEAAARNGTAMRLVPMSIRKGYSSVHHGRTFHFSGHNRSSRSRRVIQLCLQPGTNAFREFRLDDGQRAVYNHDWLVRPGRDGRPDYADPDFCPVIWRAPMNVGA